MSRIPSRVTSARVAPHASPTPVRTRRAANSPAGPISSTSIVRESGVVTTRSGVPFRSTSPVDRSNGPAPTTISRGASNPPFRPRLMNRTTALRPTFAVATSSHPSRFRSTLTASRAPVSAGYVDGVNAGSCACATLEGMATTAATATTRRMLQEVPMLVSPSEANAADPSMHRCVAPTSTVHDGTRAYRLNCTGARRLRRLHPLAIRSR